MGIVKDLSGLPEQGSGSDGVTKDDEAMRFLSPLADAWHAAYIAGGNEERAFAVEGTRFRASWAGGCARALSYRVLHNDAKMAVARGGSVNEIVRLQSIAAAYKETDPPSLADSWRMGLGSKVHELFEDAVRAVFPTAECEFPVDLRPDIDGSATGDVFITEETQEARHYSDGDSIAVGQRTTLLELKTINGFGFKRAVMAYKGPAEGPKHNHLLQAGLAARARKADRVVIGYLSMECISKDIADRNGLSEAERFMGAWSYTLDELTPMLDAETARINKVLDLVDQGELAPRAIADPEVPDTARIVDPARGIWHQTQGGKLVNSGAYWGCRYCWHQTRCIEDGAEGEIPVELRLRGT